MVILHFVYFVFIFIFSCYLLFSFCILWFCCCTCNTVAWWVYKDNEGILILMSRWMYVFLSTSKHHDSPHSLHGLAFQRLILHTHKDLQPRIYWTLPAINVHDHCQLQHTVIPASKITGCSLSPPAYSWRQPTRTVLTPPVCFCCFSLLGNDTSACPVKPHG